MPVFRLPGLPDPTEPYAPRSTNAVTLAIVHHSASPLTTTIQQIDAEHRARGFIYVGYHFTIDTNGNIDLGRPLWAIPAAAYGYNSNSVDICCIGNFQSDDPGYTGPPSDHQVAALTDLLIWCHHQVPTIDRTCGHGDLMADACPGNKLEELLPGIKQKIRTAIHI
jgi:hypothetical protein